MCANTPNHATTTSKHTTNQTQRRVRAKSNDDNETARQQRCLLVASSLERRRIGSQIKRFGLTRDCKSTIFSPSQQTQTAAQSMHRERTNDTNDLQIVGDTRALTAMCTTCSLDNDARENTAIYFFDTVVRGQAEKPKSTPLSKN